MMDIRKIPNLKMTNDKAQMSNQAIWIFRPYLNVCFFLLNYLWPDFDIVLYKQFDAAY